MIGFFTERRYGIGRWADLLASLDIPKSGFWPVRRYTERHDPTCVCDVDGLRDRLPESRGIADEMIRRQQ